jgi:hypothetical protein
MSHTLAGEKKKGEKKNRCSERTLIISKCAFFTLVSER